MNNISETPKPHILIVDDDSEIRDLLSRFLSKHDFRVTTAKDGRDMRQAFADWSFDLVVLDLMMPGEDGLTLCRHVRGESAIPIIMLTAMGEDVDRIIGLEVGADDYMAKPFNPRELAARIKAVLRRSASSDGTEAAEARPDKMMFAGFTLDPVTRTLQRGLESITLTAGDRKSVV